MDILKRAYDAAGGATVLADKLGVTLARLSMWKSRGKVPPEYCRAIEVATAGEVTRYELAPDVFGDPPTKRKAA